MINNDFNYANLGSKLFSFEEKMFDTLSTIKIGKWNAWRVIKSEVFFSAIYKGIRKKVENSSAQRSQSNFKLLVSSIKGFYKLLYYFVWRIFKKNVACIVTLSINKTVKNEDGLWVDVVVDNLIKKAGIKNFIYIEVPDNNGKYLQKAFIKRSFLSNEFSFFIFSIHKFLEIIGFFQKQAAEIESTWLAYFKCPFPLESKNTNAVFNKFYGEYFFYKLFFSITRPALLVVNDQMATGKIAAAKVKGIKTIELQHGMMDEYYPQYHLHPNFLAVKISLPLAEKIGVFGQFHKNQLTKKLFYKEEDVEVIGKYDTTSTLRRISRFSNNKTIVFVTQGKLLFEQSKVDLTNLINQLNFTNYFLIIKLHPLESEHLVDWYLELVKNKANVRVIKDEFNINQILPVADIVLGYNSTVLLEAAYHNKVVVTLPDMFCKKGIFTVTGEDEILEGCIDFHNSIDSFINDLNRFEVRMDNEEVKNYLYDRAYSFNVKKMINNEFPI